jgi:hypothetical protein
MNVTHCQSVPLSKILDETPDGKVAMFRVTGVLSTGDDRMMDQNIYVHRGRVRDFMSDTDHGAPEQFCLHFCGYFRH